MTKFPSVWDSALFGTPGNQCRVARLSNSEALVEYMDPVRKTTASSVVPTSELRPFR